METPTSITHDRPTETSILFTIRTYQAESHQHNLEKKNSASCSKILESSWSTFRILWDKDSTYKHRQNGEQNVQQKSDVIYLKKDTEIITAFGNF